MKKKSPHRRARRRMERRDPLMPAHALEEITEWERLMESDPENTSPILELNWRDKDCLLGGITIERLQQKND